MLRKLCEALNAAGVKAEMDWTRLKVADCLFTVEETKRGYKFLGSSFKVDEDGNFDVARAVGLLMAELPQRIIAAAKIKREQDGMRDMDAVHGPWHGASAYRRWKDVDGFQLTPTCDGIAVTFTVPDLKAAMEFIDAQKGAR